MKNFLGSIANRVFAILLVGILLATGVTAWLAEREREAAIEEMRASHGAERIEQLVLALDQTEPASRPAILQAGANFGMLASLVDGPMPTGGSGDNALVELLKVRLGAQRQIALQQGAPCQSRPLPPPQLGAVDHPPFERLLFQMHRDHDCRVVLVGLSEGQLLRVQLRSSGGPFGLRSRPPLPTAYHGLFLLLIGLLAYFVARMTARPIRQLADAAGALGSDLDRPPLPETGPTEIRQAASAFNAMQQRIRRQVAHRTHMLAAITHDLQTPLTRLRLRLEKVSDAELRTKLIDDLALMQSMVREGLDLARSMDSQERLQRLDLDSLIDSVCADAADAGQDVTLAGHAGAFIFAQPTALRRCLTNLLDNAIKYGKQARVTMTREHDRLVLRVHDAGPGLPEDQLEAVFDPFFRLETSRSRDTGGTGLGLTIARNVAESHGGTLVLRNHPDGGLEAILRLPVIAV
ncbi:signal transduction histidine kinase [Actimicrobium sp. GrIS 1.19]|uniref:ATP-binding protein n=1 Tax=Actimicrobium sp. GrIS 1.19 TaxID=3071708 RepID=UPI002DFC9871|nr:signal transduction histidine kinase [Actimicrobium sp. GrIS 1.19]